MTKKTIFKISNMHCAACVINIDGELEETEGIKKSDTNYAQQKTEVTYDSGKINSQKIIEIIKKVGYVAEVFA